MSAIGQIPHRSDIINVTTSFPCIVTTTQEHGYITFDFVRLTNLNGAIPIPHGLDPLNNNKYRIIVLSEDTFKLQNPITFKDIDSTNFPPYTTGGNANLVENTFIFYGPPEE